MHVAFSRNHLRLIHIILGLLVLTQALPRSYGAEALHWTDLKDLNVEGRGWNDTLAPYDRLPGRAEKKVRSSVWGLSRQSAGIHARFITDAPSLNVRWALTSPNLALPHMPATGVSGLDLYVRTEKGDWRWLAGGRPEKQTNSVVLFDNLPRKSREFLIYLPLYNGTRFVELGVPEGSQLTRAGSWGPGTRKPMVFYGTSILQGACASRPGMAHTAILGRRFNFAHINLGFSGSGRMEPEMAELIAELDASIYVLDCLPNMNAEEVKERVEPFVKTLRASHPNTPIVLVEDRFYADSFLITSKRERNDTNHAALKAVYQRLQKSGVKQLYYLPGAKLLGDDGEATVDSSHPNDLGFLRQADVHARLLAPLLKKALNGH